MGTRRNVSPADKARFFQAIAAGSSILDACRIAGIHVNTGSRWLKKSKLAQAKRVEAEFDVRKHVRDQGGVQRDADNDLGAAAELPPAVPLDRLCAEAKRGLEDFDFFRKYYLGRVPSPWQVEAAVTLVQLLEAEDKEFVCLNVPPGAGKSTLFHDVAVWAIVRNRAIRVMIGSISQAMAKQYSRRIRETLERPAPIQPDPELVKKGLAVNAEGCLSIDYGRFKPSDKGALWRADEFIVEQYDGNGLDNKEPTVRAYGIDAEFIGHRADLCLFDDVASTENCRESVARDKLLERWDSMAEARCDPGGLLAVIGQRLGSGDLYAHCLAKVTYDVEEEDYDGSDVTLPEHIANKEPTKSSKYKHIIYQAYYPELDSGPASRKTSAPAYPNGPLLDPKRLSWKDLSYLRYNSPEKFRVIYQQEDLAGDTYLIDRTWITGGIGTDGVLYQGCVDGERQHGTIPPGLVPPVISIVAVDPSPTQFWALIWILYQPTTNLYYVIDIERVKLTAEELLGYNTTTSQYSGIMEEWQNRSMSLGYPISHWVVEINAAQRFLLAHDFVRKWQALHGVNVLPHTTTRNKLDENMGVEALLPPLFRSGAVRLPTMRANWKTLAAADELAKWTRDKKNGTDIVMALWMAVLNLPNLTNMKLPPRQWRPSWLLK
jgi:transposase-like protein